LIICRCKLPCTEGTKNKISTFCNVHPNQVISVHDVGSIYRVPIILHEQKVTKFIRERLQLPKYVQSKLILKKWRQLALKSEGHSHGREVTIALVGKYVQLEDAYLSVIKALKHAALAVNRKLTLKFIDSEFLQPNQQEMDPARYYESMQKLCCADGIIVPGGFGDRGIEGKMVAINWARRNNKPYLGICLGMQLAVVEFCRNVMNWEGANSAEFDKDTKYPVIISMPEHHTGVMGGTMRCGQRKTIFKEKEKSIMYKMYGKKAEVSERHRHRYECNPEFTKEIASKGLKFVGEDVDGERMEIVELEGHPFFVGCQAHPEFTSRPLKPSPPYLGLILASIGKLEKYLDDNCTMKEVLDMDSDDDEFNEEFHRMILDDEKDELTVRSSPRKQSKADPKLFIEPGPGGDN